jgi:hypothetical protein
MLAAAVLAVAILAGCGSAATMSPPGTAEPALTAVPGGMTPPPDPLPDEVTTTETEWGTILDAVPTAFPVFPGAEPADWPDGPVSAAWLATAAAEELAGWYEGALLDQGWATVEGSGPLEDGSWNLDAWADIPECRLQAVFHPAGESTIITVRYAAACAGGEG